MAGLYQRTLAPNTASPAMQVAASQGAAGGIPRGDSDAMPQQGQGIDAAQLGGLLGMIRNSAAHSATGEGVFNPGEGVFNPGVMPGVGQSMALGGGSAAPSAATTTAQSAPSAGVLGAGIPTDGMGLSFDPSKLTSILGGLGFGA